MRQPEGPGLASGALAAGLVAPPCRSLWLTPPLPPVPERISKRSPFLQRHYASPRSLVRPPHPSSPFPPLFPPSHPAHWPAAPPTAWRAREWTSAHAQTARGRWKARPRAPASGSQPARRWGLTGLETSATVAQPPPHPPPPASTLWPVPGPLSSALPLKGGAWAQERQALQPMVSRTVNLLPNHEARLRGNGVGTTPGSR